MNNLGMYSHETDWAIGDTVRIDDDPLYCRVTAILIRDRGVQLEVSWVNAGTPGQAWIEPWRLSGVIAQTAGFAPPTADQYAAGIPPNYRPMPPGSPCKCIHALQEANGNRWCCQGADRDRIGHG